MEKTRTVGIDLDNTIVSYDGILRELAAPLAPGLGDHSLNKRMIRDRIRLLPDGEVVWQELQAKIYGPCMGRASLIDGVMDFLDACRARAWQVYIVSHKTEYANYDTTKTHLHQAARDWLRDKGFFVEELGGLAEDEVFFETTRQAKIDRIVELGCEVFIDDLVEMFQEETFPADVLKILYDPSGECADSSVISLPDWRSIKSEVLHRFC